MCVFARACARGVCACMYVCAYARVFVRLSVCLSASVAVWFAGADQLGRHSCPTFVRFRLSLLAIVSVSAVCVCRSFVISAFFHLKVGFQVFANFVLSCPRSR